MVAPSFASNEATIHPTKSVLAQHSSSQVRNGGKALTTEGVPDAGLDSLKRLALCWRSLFDTMLCIFPSITLSSLVEEATRVKKQKQPHCRITDRGKERVEKDVQESRRFTCPANPQAAVGGCAGYLEYPFQNRASIVAVAVVVLWHLQ
jgi:hypothetical protein